MSMIEPIEMRSNEDEITPSRDRTKRNARDPMMSFNQRHPSLDSNAA